MTGASATAWLEEARALLRARQPAAALERYRQVLAVDPGNADAHFMAGIACAELGDFPGAIASIDQAIARKPAQPASSRLAFAQILADAGDATRSEREAREALALHPGWAPALSVLGAALQRLQREDEALAAFTSAIEADARFVPAHRNRARLLHRRAQVHEAIGAYGAALALDAGDADLWNELAVAYADAALHQESRAAMREALRRRPAYHQVESNLLVALHYDPAFDAAAAFQAHRDWSAHHAAGLAPKEVPRRRTLAAGERLRVGFLSPALREGPTGYFVRPVFENLDRARFEIHAYNARGARDEFTHTLEAHTDAWYDAWSETDAELADRIRADRIDILVDLAGHAPGGRPLVLARKPAPVIATWLDYFDTTGLDAVGFLVGDPVSTPEGGPQRFSERVVRLDPCRLCYSPPEYAPPVVPPPAVTNAFVTFGSFNRRSKITPEVVALWTRVLRAVEPSRLLLKSAAMADARMRETLLAAFEAGGIERGRVELRPHSPHAQMLAEYGDIDIALDTFPYNGGLTTCEALWMGVPVLAIAGDSMISRQSAALLSAAGLGDWVAQDEAAFVALARERAKDAQALARLRSGMREKLAASPLMDARTFGRRFGDALLAMWR